MGTGSGTTRGDPHYLEASELAVANKNRSIRDGSLDAASLSEALTLILTGIIAAAHNLITARGTPDPPRGRRMATVRQRMPAKRVPFPTWADGAIIDASGRAVRPRRPELALFVHTKRVRSLAPAMSTIKVQAA
jgi:hypothetical protein